LTRKTLERKLMAYKMDGKPGAIVGEGQRDKPRGEGLHPECNPPERATGSATKKISRLRGPRVIAPKRVATRGEKKNIGENSSSNRPVNLNVQFKC